MSFKAIEMMRAVTRRRSKGTPPSLKPMRDYFAQGEPFHEFMRGWLIRLMSPKGINGARLILVNLPGRKSNDITIAREHASYLLYNELRERGMSRGLLKQLANAKGGRLEFEEREKRVREEWLPGQVYYRIRPGGWTKFDRSKPVSAMAARLIVAHKHGWREPTLRKVLARWDRAANYE